MCNSARETQTFVSLASSLQDADDNKTHPSAQRFSTATYTGPISPSSPSEMQDAIAAAVHTAVQAAQTKPKKDEANPPASSRYKEQRSEPPARPAAKRREQERHLTGRGFARICRNCQHF